MWQFETALEQTVAWYRHLHEKTANAYVLCDQQIDRPTAAVSAAALKGAA